MAFVRGIALKKRIERDGERRARGKERKTIVFIHVYTLKRVRENDE